MAQKEDLRQIGQEGFKVIDRFYPNCTVPANHHQHGLRYHPKEAPLETVQFPHLVYQITRVSQIPLHFFSSTSPQQPPPSFQFSLMFPARQQNHARGHHENRFPSAEPAVMNNFKAAQLFGGTTRIDYGKLN
ncbi:hypothetical protein SAY87_028185 [Trapa incisa]|uniref:Uncharacterized protein n=1 Tax=Trapa incisa TaxID=236973 RepID=A0AAN7L1L4_9MYRT|nr:hypothetical protein SAY87_028185 [Trapa incisa]